MIREHCPDETLEELFPPLIELIKKKTFFNRLAVQQARTLQGFPGWWVGGTIQVFNLPGGSLFYGQGAHGCTSGTDT